MKIGKESELKLEFLIVIGEIVEDVGGQPNRHRPSSEHRDVALQLLQRRRLVRLPLEHSRKHLRRFPPFLFAFVSSIVKENRTKP